MRIITELETRSVLTTQNAAATIADTYRAAADGSVFASTPSLLKITGLPHRLGAKGAVLGHENIAGIRLTSRAAPRQFLWSLETGEPIALIDESYLYRLRTAVSAAVVANSLLPNKLIAKLCIIGTGPIAFEMVQAFHALFQIQDMVVVARSAENTNDFCQRAIKLGVPVRPMLNIASAVEEATLIITITTANKVLVELSDVDENATIISMGGGLEVSHQLWQRASVRFIDDLDYALQQGDAASWIQSGLLSRTQFENSLTGTVSQLLAGECAVSQNPNKTGMAIVQGMTALDIALGHYVFSAVTGSQKDVK